MTDSHLNVHNTATRQVVTAACVVLFGLIVTTGLRAAHADELRPPRVPALLEVEDGNEVFLIGHAAGTQNYVCVPSATAVGGFAFSLFTPQATLLDRAGDQLTTHFFSPNNDPHATPPEAGAIRATWEDSDDTSRVWGFIAQQSSDARYVRPDAIPWLLVQKSGVAAGPTGGRHLAKTTFIQRVNTVGGQAPPSGCRTIADVGVRAFVPYAADYVFYRRAHDR